MLKTLLEIRDGVLELVRQGREARQARRPLAEDNLVTPEEIRIEVGWGDDRLRAWLRTLPVRRYPGKKTDLYRWGDVLARLPVKEPAGGVALLEEEDAGPPIPRGDEFACR